MSNIQNDLKEIELLSDKLTIENSKFIEVQRSKPPAHQLHNKILNLTIAKALGTDSEKRQNIEQEIEALKKTLMMI
ncbi:MAG: hypothetical protein ABL903_12460 [Methylococcales bacterium]